MKRSLLVTALVAVMVGTGAVAGAAFGAFGSWSTAVDVESSIPGAHPDFNTSALEGCPFVSPDGKMFFMASNRGGGEGMLDIWVSTRDHTDDPWGAPVNLGPPINSTSNDFCPTIGRDGKSFFFVSNRPGYCGGGDIFTARFGDDLTVEAVEHLGCEVNSAWDEHSPFPTNLPGLGPVLFYSSARPSGGGDAAGDHDLYMSTSHGGVFQAGEVIPGVNTTAQDGQPNVRRDGLELFFYSDRAGGVGGNDIYSTSRASVFDGWGTPVNLGPAVNSSAAESRPSLSWDGTTLYFGSTRAGSSDIYVTTR
ncbi:MAG: hypothetical protein ACLGHX_10165 [Acidimicrobiia bacterium]